MSGERESESGMDGRMSFLRVEKEFLGELDPEESARLERDIAGVPRLAAVRRRMRAAESSLTWQELRAQIESRSNPSRPDDRIAGRLRVLGRPAVRNVMALAGFLLVLAIPSVFFTFGKESGLRPKGVATTGAHVELDFRGDRLAPDGQAAAASGDTLGFWYRSEMAVHVQVWYREDGGDLKPFDGKEESGFSWPATSVLARARERIRLEGEWSRQRILVLVSPEPMSPSEARRRLETGGLRDGVFVFDLLAIP